MDNRFGVKELIISVLLVAVLLAVLLAMKQYDRQWDKVNQLSSQLSEQVTAQARVQRQLGEIEAQLDRVLTQLDARAAIDPEQLRELLAGRGKNPTTQPANSDAEPKDRGDAFARIKAAQANPDYALGDWFVDVFSVVPDRLTPLVSTDVYASSVQNYVLESLAARDPETLEWQPLLATDWQISDDGLQITFDLRRGVTFSDGEPFDADDVVFTFSWMMNPEVEAPRQRAYYEQVQSVEKLGKYRVVFTFKQPYFQAFELAGGMQIMPEHFYSRFSPTEFNRSTGLLMGSGPYRLADPESWRPEPGKPIELIRNERYWGEPAAFNKLVWRVIENDAARLTTFTNGDIDAFYAQPEQYESLIKDESLMKRVQRFEFQRPTAGYLFIAWNQQRNNEPTKFADKRVRQAMTLLTDRERLVNEILLGYGQVATGPFSPLTQQSDKTVEPWPYDPSRAKALLAEAGFKDGDGDGVIESPDGQPLVVTLSHPAGSETFDRIVLFLKDTFARAGVVLKSEPLEWSVLLQRIDQRDIEAVSLGWSGGIESDPYQIFHSSQMGEKGDNFVSYRNTDLDALIDNARATVQEEQRMPMWHQVHRILHEDQPYTFLFTRKTLAFFNGRIKNVQRTSLGLNPITEWYVPKDQQRWTQ